MSTMSKKKPSPLRRGIHAMCGAVCRVRDLFMCGAAGCSRFVDVHGAAIGGYPGCPLAPITCDFTGAYKASWAHVDGVRELPSAALLSSSLLTQKPRVSAPSTVRGAAVVGRIDEDVECEFGDELPVGSNLLLPRVSPSMRYVTAGCRS